jgi:hypothetical protein
LAKRCNVAHAFGEIREIEPGDSFDGFRLRREQSLQRANFNERRDDPQLACVGVKGLGDLPRPTRID